MVYKMMVLLADTVLVLPSDWNPNDNVLWAWGPGGRGMNDAGAPFLTGGGGGGAGAFDQSLNVGGSAGDSWTIQVGLKNTGGTGTDPIHPVSGATFVQDAALNYLVYADAGNNAASQIGAIGGSGSSLAGSNSGGISSSTSGGGGGAAAAGPHNSSGTRGGSSDTSQGGGGGGAGAVGDFTSAEESQAEAGGGSVSKVGGDGGEGYYGTGSGAGGASLGSAGANGSSNTGGGAGGGYGPRNVGAGNNGSDGGDGASWDYILTLTPGVWMDAPFTWATSASGKWAELSNGTVPGGGGGGGGGAYGGNGGNGGFPGGGGGGAADSFGEVAVGGDGADGLLIIFYTPLSPSVAGRRWLAEPGPIQQG